jgi:hypothetical protein
MVHFLILLRLWAALFVSPPSSPSDEEELPPPSPPPPQHLVIPPQHQRPVAVVQPLPPMFANQPMRIHHENIIWPGTADHPARRTCHQAGRVGHYRCSPGRPCLRPHPSAQIPHSTTNGFQSMHGQDDISEENSWEDFDWTAGAAAAAAPYQQRQQQEHHEWSQDDWEENVSAAAAAAAADSYKVRNAAAGHNGYAHRGIAFAHRWENEDWAASDEWEQDPDLPLMQPDPEHEGLPISAHSSLPLLESVPRTPSPSSSPQPLQLQYIPEGDAGPT